MTGSDWDSVACGYDHTLAIKTDGSLWATGRNDKGQLGLGDTTTRNNFTSVSANWEQVACGSKHSLAITTSDIAYATGYNIKGQLGQGDNGAGTDRDTLGQCIEASPYTAGTDKWEHVVCGSQHSMALKIE